MNDNYWLKRVATKLNASFLSGKVMHQWVPDQEDPEAESRALDTLEVAGIIKSPGGFEGAPSHLQYRVIDLKSGRTRSAPTRKIVDFDYDKFIRFCETNGLSLTANDIDAQLEIVDGVQPVIIIEDTRYPFTPLSAGMLPQRIIAYSWKQPDNRLSLNELRQNIDTAQLQKDDANLNQIFDKKNIFGKHGNLKAFAEIEAKTFLLKRSALLTPNEVEAIKLASSKR